MSPRIDPMQESFIAGEISPRLIGRTSLDLYKAGLSKCENFIVYPHGGVTKRGGFRYVAEVKDSTKTTILQKFNYKDEFQYVFEFGHNYIRVFRDQAAVISLSAGIDWTIRTTPVDNGWTSVCWSPKLSLFCAVALSGTGNRVMTSPDGIIWTIRTSVNDNDWRSICWSPELDLFCAVANTGTGNRVMTSPDGIVWTIRTSAVDNNWDSVCWSPELTLFCAVTYDGTDNSVMTSPDGITWTIRTTPVGNAWQSVCWSPELALFCAVANTGAGNRVMTSPDGITWTSRTTPVDNYWRSVCWSPELDLFCAIAHSGTGNRVMTSPDGINWTVRTSAADNSWTSVCWSPECTLFVAVAYDGTGNNVMTSPDGVVWTIRTTPVDNNWQFVCWSPELALFCAVANSGTNDRVMTSPGNPPYEIVTTYTESEVRDLRFTQDEEKLFIVHKDHPPAELVRTDHDDWTFQNIAFSNNGILTVDNIVEPEKNVWTSRDAAAIVNWQSICWSPELKIFCAVSNTGTDRIMTSPDGVIWSIRTAPITRAWQSVCWSPELGLFCAVSSDGVYATGQVITSSDGIVWITRLAVVERAWQSVCWSSELTLFVAVGAGPASVYEIMTSPDGINWTLRELDTSVCLWESVCWSSDLSLFVAVGYGSQEESFKVMTSPDGINWTRRSAAARSNWQSVCWNTNVNLFVAVANSGLISERIMTSPDGITWTLQTAPVNNSWREVCWNSKLGSFVAVSNSGTTDKVMISSDGITWTLQITPGINDWTSVCYSPELNLLVAVADSGASYRVMTYSFGFTNGTYEEVKLITDEDDDGREAEVTVVVANNSIDTITVTKPGALYEINDTLRIDPTDIGGSAYVSDDEDEDEDAGLTTCDVATLTTNDIPDEWGPGVATVDTIVDQSDHDNGTYEDVELSGGSGSGVRATVIVEANSVSSVIITESGSLYEVNDTLTIPTDIIGGTDPVTCDVAILTIENYPTLIWFFEQRFWLAATPNESNQIWGSRSANYFNLYLGDGLDDEGIAVTIKGATKLLWAVDGSTAIIFGAHNGEFKLASNSLNDALTPSNIRPVRITNYGNAFIPVVQINADILFVQKGLRIVRRLRYDYASNSYVAIPVSLISEHITESGIVDVAYSNEPNSIFWAIRTDGVLIAMTYDPDNKIFGWHRHLIGGVNTKAGKEVPSTVQSIVNIDGATDVAKDELWAIIERTINSETVKYVEFLVPEGLSLEDDLEDAFFVESGVTKTGSGFTTFDGLDHLEGEEVRILADGAVQVPKTVSGGEITLDIAVDKAHVGLAYNASIETLPLEGGNPIGTAQAKIKRVSSMVLRLYRSLTFYMGDVFGNEDVYPFGPPEEMGSAIPLFTGDTEEQAFPGGYDTQGKVRIASYDPVPLTILAIMYELRVKD